MNSQEIKLAAGTTALFMVGGGIGEELRARPSSAPKSSATTMSKY
ncbi:MAG: hypothetical protein R3C27_12705 [Hyphomonadaceae bacterium]